MKHLTTLLIALMIACAAPLTAQAQLSVRPKKPVKEKTTKADDKNSTTRQTRPAADSRGRSTDRTRGRDGDRSKTETGDRQRTRPTPNENAKGKPNNDLKTKPAGAPKDIKDGPKDDVKEKPSSPADSVSAPPPAATDTMPAGRLVYCSYSIDRPAGGGYTYCELVLDGEEPTVNVNRDRNCRFAENQVRAFTDIDEEQTDSLQQLILDREYFRLNGYNEIEATPGATTYRIHIEFESGEKITARWCAAKPREKAVQAFDDFVRFFNPWLEQVPQVKTR